MAGREHRAPAPLAAKGVLKRWGLAEDQRYVGLPDAVFAALVRFGVTPGEFFVFSAMLAHWDWRRGMKQHISVRAVSRTMGRDSREMVRRALIGLHDKGAILYHEAVARSTLGPVVDLSFVRHEAQEIAKGRGRAAFARPARGGNAFGKTTTPLVRGRASPWDGDVPPPCASDVPPPWDGDVPHSECSEKTQSSDAPRSSFLSLQPRQPDEGEDAYRTRLLAGLAEQEREATHALRP